MNNFDFSEETTFSEVLKKTSIAIFTYDSTGFLEAMAKDIPSLFLQYDEINPIRKNRIKYFELLEDVKILHKSNNSLISHLIEIENDLEKWWNNKEVVKVRKLFCSVHAKNDSIFWEEVRSII